MATGGDWKQLFRASGDGTIWEISYHLDQKVDPNYQHPEFFSSALCEASRNGQIEAIKLLLKRGADPFIREDLSGLLPIEIALSERRHEVVDLFLRYMDETATFSIIKRIYVDTNDVKLVEAIARTGHFVIWKAGTNHQNAELIRNRTNNNKLEVLSEEEELEFPMETKKHSHPVHFAVFDNRSTAINVAKHSGSFGPDTTIICARPISLLDRTPVVVRRNTLYCWPNFLSFEQPFHDAVLSLIFPDPPRSGFEF